MPNPYIDASSARQIFALLYFEKKKFLDPAPKTPRESLDGEFQELLEPVSRLFGEALGGRSSRVHRFETLYG